MVTLFKIFFDTVCIFPPEENGAQFLSGARAKTRARHFSSVLALQATFPLSQEYSVNSVLSNQRRLSGEQAVRFAPCSLFTATRCRVEYN